MVYALIALTVALLTSVYLNFLWLNESLEIRDFPQQSIVSTQSEIYEDMKRHDDSFRDTIEHNEEEERVVNVAIYNNNAYWVNEDGFITAPLNDEQEIIYSMQQQIDVHSMNESEVDMLLNILDALKEESP